MNNHQTIFSRAIITWILFIPIVFANATIRELFYKRFIGELAAHQISTIIAIVAFVLLAFFVLHHSLYNTSNIKLLLIGLMWVSMTAAFEFALGRFVDGASWDKLLYDYNLSEGRIWTLLLLAILITPFIVKYLINGRA
jgi:hypothetical protein